MPAPIRVRGAKASSPPASTTSRSGASDPARAVAGTTASAVTPTIAYSASTPNKARGMALGMVISGSRTSSPIVAIRA